EAVSGKGGGMTRSAVFAGLAWAALAPQSDPVAPIRFLEGKWESAAIREPGKGVQTREYKFELGGPLPGGRNQTGYGPPSHGADPEVDEDRGIFSYDRGAKKLVLRQFHVEGFVNEYTLDSAAPDGKSLEFVTVRIENIAPGWRAKEAYRVVSADEVEETFSL